MSDRARRDWTVTLQRRAGVDSWSWSLGSTRVLATIAGAALLLLALGAGLGLAWANRAEGARVSALRARVDSLGRERSRILALAARLDSVDQAYRRLRVVMGGDIAPSKQDLALPSDEVGGEEAAPASGSDGYDWPLARKGFVTRGHQEGAEGPAEGHPGIDIAVPTGSYVRASSGGVVTEAGDDDVYGRYVRIDHGGGVRTLYAHNLWLFVRRGDSVARDEVIALSGNSGRSTAPHLHFEVTRGGRSVDPARLVRMPGG